MEYIYLKGKEVVIEDNLNNYDPKKFAWLRVKGIQNIETISQVTSIPLDDFKYFYEEEERSRLEHGRFLQIIYQCPFTEKGEITTAPIKFFIVNNTFITVEKENNAIFSATASSLKNNKLKFLLKKGHGELLYYFLDKINDKFLITIDKIANIADVMESKAEEVTTKQLMSLYNYNVTLTHFNQALLANMEVLIALKKSHFKKFEKHNLEDFTDLYYDTLHVIDTEKIQREVISNLFNFQTLVSTHKLNQYMKKLTSLSIIILVPTFITGLFGMNVDIPMQHNPFAFLFIILGLIAIGLVIFLAFKFTDWL